jgi:hypothetical protein
MQCRLLISASLIVAFAPLAAAQQTSPQQSAPQPSRPAEATKPKPKKAASPKKPASAAPPSVKAGLLEKIKDWTVFVYEGADGRVCFAATAPTDMQPKTAKRTPVIFYVTTWQKDGVHNEVSVKLGYSMKGHRQRSEFCARGR